MSHTPADSAIKMNPTLEEQVSKASSGEEITQLLRDAMIAQQLVTVDAINPDVIYEAPRVTPKGYAKTITDGTGRKLIFQGDSELEMERSIGDYFRSLHPAPAAAETPDQPRDSAGRFVQQPQEQFSAAEQAEAVRQNDLSLKFRRGEISADQYISESGAVERHLEEHGIDIAALQEVSSQKVTRTWVEAAERFQQRHPDWGNHACEENKNILGHIIIDSDLMDSDPLEALETAYAHALKENLLVENPSTTYANEISACTTNSELEAVNAKWFPNGRRVSGSVLFDR